MDLVVEGGTGRRATGVRLIRFAWGVEVLAATVGLVIAEVDNSIRERREITNSGRVAALEDSLRSTRQQIQDLSDRQRERESSIRADFESAADNSREGERTNLVTLEQQLAELDRKVRDLDEQEVKALERGGVFGRGRVREDYRGRRADVLEERGKVLEQIQALSARAESGERLGQQRDVALAAMAADVGSQIADLRAEERTLSEQVAEARGTSEESLAPEIERLEQSKTRIQEKYDELQVATENNREAALAERQEQGLVKSGLLQERQEPQSDRSVIKSFINTKVVDNQVYRITALWTGIDDASEIGREQLRITAIVWFGSLAAIVACTGTILAFAGLVVMDERKTRPARSLRGSDSSRLRCAAA